ncbi:hypothetical protein HZS_4 [Henneguya salminicola]|nr:hypothetical protein HZS_4 [Henneguya salminicola]
MKTSKRKNTIGPLKKKEKRKSTETCKMQFQSIKKTKKSFKPQSLKMLPNISHKIKHKKNKT